MIELRFEPRLAGWHQHHTRNHYAILQVPQARAQMSQGRAGVQLGVAITPRPREERCCLVSRCSRKGSG